MHNMFEPWTSGLTAGCADSMSVWAVVLTGMKVKFVLQLATSWHSRHHGWQSKVQWLETSDSKLYKTR